MKQRWPVWALVVWTALVWGSRIRNILGNDELDATGQAVRVAIAVVFLASAAAVVVWLVRGAVGRAALTWLVIWTTGFWLVRGIGMLFDDRTIGFKTVHTVLAIISIGLAALAWRSPTDRRQAMSYAGEVDAR